MILHPQEPGTFGWPQAWDLGAIWWPRAPLLPAPHRGQRWASDCGNGEKNHWASSCAQEEKSPAHTGTCSRQPLEAAQEFSNTKVLPKCVNDNGLLFTSVATVCTFSVNEFFFPLCFSFTSNYICFRAIT